MAAFAPSPIPKALQYYFHTVNVSRQRTRIYPADRGSATPGSVIIFQMPNTHTLLDTMSLHFDLTTAAVDSNCTYCRLSDGVESMFDSISVQCQGQTIDGGVMSGWNRLTNILNEMRDNEGNDTSRRLLENQLSAVPAGFHTNSKLALKKWTGFLASVQPRCVNFALAPVTVYVKLAGTSAFITDNAAKATITVSDVHLNVDTIQLNDGGMYDRLILDKLNKGDALELPFERWTSYSKGAAALDDTLSFGVSTTSLKGLLGVFVAPEAFSSATWSLSNAQANNTYRSQFFNNGLGGSNELETSFFSVQDVPFPSYPATVPEMCDQTVLNFANKALPHYVTSIADYQKSLAAHYVTFGLQKDDDTYELRARDGINLLGQSAQVSWSTKAASQNTAIYPTKIIYAQTQPVLRIKVGRQIEVLN